VRSVVVSHLCRAPPNAEKFIVCIVSVVYLRAWSHREMLNVSGGGGANTQCVLSVWPPHTTFCRQSSPLQKTAPPPTAPPQKISCEQEACSARRCLRMVTLCDLPHDWRPTSANEQSPATHGDGGEDDDAIEDAEGGSMFRRSVSSRLTMLEACMGGRDKGIMMM
jgi:hypothetical protein